MKRTSSLAALAAVLGSLDAPPLWRAPTPAPQAPPLQGHVRLSDYSSIRKLMRAARREKLPDETLQKIKLASDEKALLRHGWYRREREKLTREPKGGTHERDR